MATKPAYAFQSSRLDEARWCGGQDDRTSERQRWIPKECNEWAACRLDGGNVPLPVALQRRRRPLTVLDWVGQGAPLKRIWKQARMGKLPDALPGPGWTSADPGRPGSALSSSRCWNAGSGFLSSCLPLIPSSTLEDTESGWSSPILRRSETSRPDARSVRDFCSDFLQRLGARRLYM